MPRLTNRNVREQAEALGFEFGRRKMRVTDERGTRAEMLWYAVPKQGECGFDPEHYGYRARTLQELSDALDAVSERTESLAASP